MALDIRLRCDNDRCRKTFTKTAREHRRCLKRGQTRFFCTRACSISFSNRNTPHGMYAVTTHLDAANKRDASTPFRWFMLRVRAREHRRGATNLTLEYLKRIWDEQRGMCPLTGWRLRLPDSTNGWRDGSVPESASLDRLDNTRGYARGNVRFVAVMVNLARQRFTDDDVQRFAAAVYHQAKKSRQRSANGTARGRLRPSTPRP